MKVRLLAGLVISLMMFGAATVEATVETIVGIMDSTNSPVQISPEINCQIKHVDNFPWRVYFRNSSTSNHNH